MVLALLLATMSTAPPARPARSRNAPQAAHEPRSLPPLDSPQLTATWGALRADVGSWAEYLVRTRGDQDVRFRVSVVPQPVDGGRVWVEVTALGSESLPVATRLLIVGATGKVERAVVYALGQAPLDVPVEDNARAVATASRSASMQVVQGRREAVAVPAGTFRAIKLRVAVGRDRLRVWKSDTVPLWGLVRARDARTTVELLRYGDRGASSVFPVQGNGSDRANE